MPDEETLREATRRYIREPLPESRNPWVFTKRDAATLAKATHTYQEEVERVFFGLCGSVWAGWVGIRNEPELYKNTYMERPPPGWTGTVRLHREWMWVRGTLPEHHP